MTSQAQHIANARNALLSTGPRTVEGRARSSHNSVTHGAYSQGVDPITVSMLKENPDELAAFVDAIVAELAPTSIIAQAAARNVAHRMVAQVRANKFVRALVEDEASDPQQVPRTSARYKNDLANLVFETARALQAGTELADAKMRATILRDNMTDPPGLYLPGTEDDPYPRNLYTTADWNAMLRLLLMKQYGGVAAAMEDAGHQIDHLEPDIDRELATIRADEARRIVAHFERLTALTDRNDRAVVYALKAFRELNEFDATSTTRLPLDGRIAREELPDPHDEDDA